MQTPPPSYINPTGHLFSHNFRYTFLMHPLLICVTLYPFHTLCHTTYKTQIPHINHSLPFPTFSRSVFCGVSIPCSFSFQLLFFLFCIQWYTRCLSAPCHCVDCDVSPTIKLVPWITGRPFWMGAATGLVCKGLQPSEAPVALSAQNSYQYEYHYQPYSFEECIVLSRRIK